MPLDDDAVIVERVLSGETEQFACLVGRYQVRLHRYAASMLGDHDAACDMVQDVFVRAFTGLATCRDPARFQSWLFRILRNRCFDHVRDPRRRLASLDDAEPVADGVEDPSARIERKRLRADLRQALDRVPPVQREAFLLHCVEGMPYDAMAKLLGASVSALKMRVLRARDTLAAAMRNREVTNPPAPRLSIRRGSAS